MKKWIILLLVALVASATATTPRSHTREVILEDYGNVTQLPDDQTSLFVNLRNSTEGPRPFYFISRITSDHHSAVILRLTRYVNFLDPLSRMVVCMTTDPDEICSVGDLDIANFYETSLFNPPYGKPVYVWVHYRLSGVDALPGSGALVPNVTYSMYWCVKGKCKDPECPHCCSGDGACDKTTGKCICDPFINSTLTDDQLMAKDCSIYYDNHNSTMFATITFLVLILLFIIPGITLLVLAQRGTLDAVFQKLFVFISFHFFPFHFFFLSLSLISNKQQWETWISRPKLCQHAY